ncbi:hypothetical protein TB2_034971 [Malus domestica]
MFDSNAHDRDARSSTSEWEKTCFSCADDAPVSVLFLNISEASIQQTRKLNHSWSIVNVLDVICALVSVIDIVVPCTV